jgi:hypothetical protein
MKKPTTKSAKPRRSASKSDPNRYPKGWDRKRVENVIAHYESQTDDQAIAEDEAAYNAPDFTMMQVPKRLVPAVEKLLAKRAG